MRKGGLTQCKQGVPNKLADKSAFHVLITVQQNSLHCDLFEETVIKNKGFKHKMFFPLCMSH